jgi:flagellar hook assembly protein FlgD
MEISEIGSTTAATAATSGTEAKELTDQFLTLLVAQLAQLQSLEQQQQLTDSNQSLLLQSSLAAGSSMIGKEVTGNITVAGQLVETTGTVQSLKVENNAVLFRVETASGEVVSMSPDHLKTVAGTGL